MLRKTELAKLETRLHKGVKQLDKGKGTDFLKFIRSLQKKYKSIKRN